MTLSRRRLSFPVFVSRQRTFGALVLAIAAFVGGCGGATEGDGPQTRDVGQCTYGEVVRTPGVVASVASLDGVVVFGGDGGQVFAAEADGSVASIGLGPSNEGEALFPLEDDVAIASTPNGLSFDRVSRYHVADGTVTTLDDVSGNGGIIRGVTSNGSTVAWLRWTAPDDATLTVERWSPDGRTSETVAPEVTGGVQSLAIAGSARYGVFATEADGVVVGRIPTGSQTKQVLVALRDADTSTVVLGADDDHVVYATLPAGSMASKTLWSVPTSGGMPVVLAVWSSPQTFTWAPSVYGHDVWWLATRADEPNQTSFFRVPIDGSVAPSEPITTTLQVDSFALDDCGLVYGTNDGSIYRAQY